MKDNLSFIDLICVIAFIPFLVPEKFLTIYVKIVIFLLGIILYLIYKLINTILKSKRLIKKINYSYSELDIKHVDLEKKHLELSKVFDKRVATLEQLNYNLTEYNHLIIMLEQSLNTSLSISNQKDKDTIKNLISLILLYKDHMRGEK